ncbi:MAG: hypothetical protein ACTHNT_11760, partial [Actinomycetales bacterium]
ANGQTKLIDNQTVTAACTDTPPVTTAPTADLAQTQCTNNGQNTNSVTVNLRAGTSSATFNVTTGAGATVTPNSSITVAAGQEGTAVVTFTGTNTAEGTTITVTANGQTKLIDNQTVTAACTDNGSGGNSGTVSIALSGTNSCQNLNGSWTVANTGDADGTFTYSYDNVTFSDAISIKHGAKVTVPGKAKAGLFVKAGTKQYAIGALDNPDCQVTGGGGQGGETAPPPTKKPTKQPTKQPTKSVTPGVVTGGGGANGGGTTAHGGGLAHTGASNAWQTVGGSMALIGFGALLLFGSRRSPVVAKPRHH